jgi:Fic family protein
MRPDKIVGMILQDYPHLEFRRCWNLTHSTLLNLGQCVAIVDCIAHLPIDPKLQDQLRRVAFSRGAQATTAIEGNTLTDKELQQLLEGIELPKSREYQGIEVSNALDAMHFVWETVARGDTNDVVTPRLLQELNRRVGRNLGKLFDGVPGRFRQDRRHVGKYLAPPHEAVVALVDQFCDWLRAEFRFDSGRQPLHEAIVQAIVAHIFFEWIHPFADGNGRTGRLLEFFVLVRAGLPDIAAHVLANHYNQSRAEYAAHFEHARTHRDLSEFIEYAVQGLCDGLKATLSSVQGDAFRIVWRSHVYDVFADYTDYKKRSIFKRRRALALEMPPTPFSPESLLQRSERLLQVYMNLDRRAILADLDVVVSLGLAEKLENGRYVATTHKISTHLANRARRPQPAGP